MCIFVYGGVLIGFGFVLFPVNVFHKLIKIKSNQNVLEHSRAFYECFNTGAEKCFINMFLKYACNAIKLVHAVSS